MSNVTNTKRSSTRIRIAASLLGTASLFATGAASATDLPVSVGEVTSPASSATASADATAIRNTAEGEIRQLDPKELPARQRVVVSLSLIRNAVAGSIVCTVNAMLRDAKTGNMIAIIESGAQSTGPVSEELSREVMHSAVRSAMRRIPRALGGSK